MRSKHIGSLFALTVAGFLTACATQQNYATAVYSWQGAPQESVYRTWGYPDRVETLPNGHKVLVYREHEQGREPIVSTPATSSVSTNPDGTTNVFTQGGTISGGGYYDYQCSTWFELGDNGNVSNTSFRGNNCLATQSFMTAHMYNGMN